MPAKDAASAPDGYITQLSGGGRTYHVYVHRCARDSWTAGCGWPLADANCQSSRSGGLFWPPVCLVGMAQRLNPGTSLGNTTPLRRHNNRSAVLQAWDVCAGVLNRFLPAPPCAATWALG